MNYSQQLAYSPIFRKLHVIDERVVLNEQLYCINVSFAACKVQTGRPLTDKTQ